MKILDLAKFLNVLWIFVMMSLFCFMSENGREIAFAAGALGIGFLNHILENWIEQ